MAEDTIFSPLGSSKENTEITDGTIVSAKLGFGHLSLVETKILTVAGTELLINGLSNCDEYIAILNIEENGGAGGALQIYVNGDVTTANYYTQYFYNDGANVGGNRTNTNYLGILSASGDVSAKIDIHRNISGKFTVNSIVGYNAPNAVVAHKALIQKVATIADITSIAVRCAVDMKIGSKISLFKVGV